MLGLAGWLQWSFAGRCPGSPPTRGGKGRGVPSRAEHPTGSERKGPMEHTWLKVFEKWFKCVSCGDFAGGRHPGKKRKGQHWGETGTVCKLPIE